MTQFLSRWLADTNAQRLVLGFHLGLTAIVFSFLVMLVVVKI